MGLEIAKFTDTYFPQINGVSYTVYLWKRELQRSGNSVRVLYPRGNYEPMEDEIEVNSLNFPFYENYRLALPFRVTKRVSKIDIVHIHTPFIMGASGAYLSKRRRIPRVATYHTPLEDYLRYMPLGDFFMHTLIPFYRFWEKRLLNGCWIVTAPSSIAKEELRRKGVRRPIEIIGNGVDLEFFRPTKPTFKEKFNAECVIGYCGRHGYEKNLEDLIRIADKFDGEILIAGDGPARLYYQKMARHKDNVKFLGYLDRKLLPEFYSSLDVFVFPSTVETQGIVALEANACGVPAVGADARALRETIKNGVSGYLYRPGDVSDLHDKIQKVMDEKKRLRKKCLEYARANSLEQSVKKIVSVYNRAIEMG